jgi:hypothetical protein
MGMFFQKFIWSHWPSTNVIYFKSAEFTSELDAVGIVPHTPPCEWDWDVSHLYRYTVTPKTAVRFLAQRYRVRGRHLEHFR